LDTKDTIIEGARSLFFKYGIKSVTMDDIAKHLGMSKKTIYQFFTDKNEVILTLIEKTMSVNRCDFDEIANHSKNAVDEILELMKHLGKMFSKMNPNLFYDMQKYHPEAWQAFRDFKEKYIFEKVENNIRKGIEEGLFRKDLKIKIIARLRLEQLELALQPNAFPPEEFNLAEVQMTLLEHYLHGIATIKGHRLINKSREVEEEE
jgi:AcrR family transcriptional regulator